VALFLGWLAVLLDEKILGGTDIHAADCRSLLRATTMVNF